LTASIRIAGAVDSLFAFESVSILLDWPKMTDVLSNREVIEKLKTLPEDEPFGCVQNNDEDTRNLLQTLYDPLKRLFAPASNSSKATSQQIRNIKKIEISHRNHFPEFKKNELSFWENDIENLRYFNEKDERKVYAFFKSACRTDKNVTDLLILRRFVDLATYKLYRRAFPEITLVRETRVKELLKLAGGSNPDEKEILNLCDIIRRGKRVRDICIHLAREKNIDEKEEEDDRIYGRLFAKNIPDAM
jgi:hypothetical protein